MMSIFFSYFSIEETEVSERLSNSAETTEESVAEPETKPTLKSTLLATAAEPSNRVSLCLSVLDIHENFANGDQLYLFLHLLLISSVKYYFIKEKQALV